MMKTLVTGATGFIGSHIVAALLARGDHVRGLVRDVERARSLRDQGVELVRATSPIWQRCAAPSRGSSVSSTRPRSWATGPTRKRRAG